MLGKTSKCLALLKGPAALWFIATDNLEYVFKKMVLFILFIREKKNNVRRISFLECLCYGAGDGTLGLQKAKHTIYREPHPSQGSYFISLAASSWPSRKPGYPDCTPPLRVLRGQLFSVCGRKTEVNGHSFSKVWDCWQGILVPCLYILFPSLLIRPPTEHDR